MRKITNNRIFSFILMGILLLFANSCPDEENGYAFHIVGTAADIDGNVYHTLSIGKQVWMAENLRVVHYNDGTAIPYADTVMGTPGYCWYNNDQSTYGGSCGALYNWLAVNTGKLCPAGWHVPTEDEWNTLISYMGGNRVAGGKLRVNEFKARFCGLRYLDWGSSELDYCGYYWSATELPNGMEATAFNLCQSDAGFYGGWDDKSYCFSVRCIKD